MPTTSPRTFSSGPPELPGLIAASVCSMFCRLPLTPPSGRAERRDDADGHGVAQAERVADRHDPVARLHLLRVAELRFLQRRRRHLGQLDQRAVGQRVAADDLRRVAFRPAVAEEADLDVFRVFDDVVVGEDEPALVDDEAGARAPASPGRRPHLCGRWRPRGLRP